MATGCLPSGVDPSVWQRALDGEVREWSNQWWLCLISTVLVTGVIGTAAAVPNHNDWRVWLVAIVVAAEGLIASRWSKQRLGTARLLQAELLTR